MGEIRKVTPSGKGCVECTRLGMRWLKLRMCMTCGHVGCCDQSPGKHATQHIHLTRHSIVRSLEPGEAWGRCYIDEIFFALPAEPVLF